MKNYNLIKLSSFELKLFESIFSKLGDILFSKLKKLIKRAKISKEFSDNLLKLYYKIDNNYSNFQEYLKKLANFYNINVVNSIDIKNFENSFSLLFSELNLNQTERIDVPTLAEIKEKISQLLLPFQNPSIDEREISDYLSKFYMKYIGKYFLDTKDSVVIINYLSHLDDKLDL